MMNYGLPEVDAVSAGAFIRVCLHLDPDERPEAEDLFGHPWMESVSIRCDCRYVFCAASVMSITELNGEGSL